MNVLVVEDTKERIKAFEEFLPRHIDPLDLHVARTPRYTAACLLSTHYNLIFWDHDLGVVKVEDNELATSFWTYLDACQAFVGPVLVDLSESACVVHSHNFNGSARLYGLLSRHGAGTIVRSPFRADDSWFEAVIAECKLS